MKGNGFMEYKGYVGPIMYSKEDHILYGKVEGILDLVSYEGLTVDEIEKEFHDAVDSYLETCKRHGKEPDKPFKGSFNVRTTQEIHRRLYLLSIDNGISLNSIVNDALDSYLKINRDAVIQKQVIEWMVDAASGSIESERSNNIIFNIVGTDNKHDIVANSSTEYH